MKSLSVIFTQVKGRCVCRKDTGLPCGNTTVPHIQHLADDVILSLGNGPKWYVQLLPLPLSGMAGQLTHACPAIACPAGQQCLYSQNVCALFCVDPVKERDQDVLPNFPDEAVLAIELIAHTTVNSV